MQIIFIPTENCNLKCYYCSRDCNTNVTHPYCNMDEFEGLLDFVAAQNPDEIDFEFFGGEPTLHPQLHFMTQRVVDRFGEKVVRLEILTNLLQPIDYYKAFPKGTKFSCSYHSKGLDGWVWMEKVMELYELDLIADVKMVMTPENELYITDLFMEYLEDSDGFNVYEILPQEQLEGSPWAEGLKEKYSQHIFDYIGDYRPRTNYKGMVCTAGYKIAQNGDVYHCWRKFNDPDSKPLLNVFDDISKKLNEYHICSYDDCDINDVDFDKYTLEEFKSEISKRGDRQR